MLQSLKHRFHTLPPEVQGIVWMLTSCFCFSVMAIMIRHISADIHPFALVFYRNVFALLIMLPILLRLGSSAFYTGRIKTHFWRGLFGVIGMLLYMIALAKIPTTRATALSFTAPLFTTIAAMIFLKEKVGIHRWGALLMGFVGVLVILRPGFEVFDYMSLIMILATCVWAISGVLIKKLSETEHPQTMVFYLTLLSAPLSFPMLLMHPQLPSLDQVFGLLALGIVSNMGQYCMFQAYGKTEITVLLPFDFSRLVFVTIMGYFLFGEVLDLWTGVGAMVIIVSTVYISRREARARKKKVQGG